MRGGSVLEDLEYIQAVIHGDLNAYAKLVSKYQTMVYRACLKMTGNLEWAEDLAQEVFIKAFDALPSYRQEALFSTWLYQVLVRTCLNWKRARGREQKHRDMTSYSDNDFVSGQTPEQTLLDKEQRIGLRKIVDNLQEPYRTAAQLFYYDNYSYQEISTKTGLTVKTVESQLYRARKIMREKGDKFL